MRGFLREDLAGQLGATRGAPQAMRPAVEIIARLSAERTRLREEVVRLREELRRAPRANDLARLRRERDAMQQELTDCKRRLSSRSLAEQRALQVLENSQQQSRPLLGLVERLERTLTRLEARERGPAHQGRVEATRPAALRLGGGGGMLAGLVKDNLVLQSRGEGQLQQALEDKTSELQPSGVAGSGGGNGLLSALWKQNLGLKRQGIN